MSNVVRLVMNSAQRQISSMFPGFFPNAKHNHYRDFGFPTDLDFTQLHGMYCRNGIAAAGVNKTILKTWQDNPFLLEQERDGSQTGQGEETTLEGQIRQRFDDLRLWARLAEADKRSLVGRYAAVILRYADSKTFDQPVDRVPGGLDGLVEVIPVWEAQLEVSEWDSIESSPTYGQPKMFSFKESAIGGKTGQSRQFNVHPDRVIIWSSDGTINGRSLLEPGYNDLLTMEKVSGAGGEGFWKNAKAAPVLEMDPETRISDMAKAMGVSEADIADKMNEQVADWQKGFDQLLMLQGIQAKTLNISLPSPEHFYGVPLQSFAASITMPVKILVGMQTGERASQEDAAEWAQTNMSRRSNQVVPSIMELVRRLERVGILPEKDWYLDWADLTEASMSEKFDRIVKMGDVNQKMKDGGEIIFTPDEMRAVAGYEPLAADSQYRDALYTEDQPDGFTSVEDATALGAQ